LHRILFRGIHFLGLRLAWSRLRFFLLRRSVLRCRAGAAEKLCQIAERTEWFFPFLHRVGERFCLFLTDDAVRLGFLVTPFAAAIVSRTSAA
jgi:hypothetical protein